MGDAMSDHTPAQIVASLLALGFTVLDQVAELGFRAPIPAVTCLLGTFQKIDDSPQFQYVSVVGSPFDPTGATHLETVIEVYHVKPPKKAAPGGLDSHSRMERGFSPVYANIRRDLPSILSDLSDSHPLPPRPAKKGS